MRLLTCSDGLPSLEAMSAARRTIIPGGASCPRTAALPAAADSQLAGSLPDPAGALFPQTENRRLPPRNEVVEVAGGLRIHKTE